MVFQQLYNGVGNTFIYLVCVHDLTVLTISKSSFLIRVFRCGFFAMSKSSLTCSLVRLVLGFDMVCDAFIIEKFWSSPDQRRNCSKGLELDLILDFGNFAYQSVVDGFYNLCKNFCVGGFKRVTMFISQHNVFAELVCTLCKALHKEPYAK